MIDRSTNVRRALRQRQGGFIINPFRFGGGAAPGDPDWASRLALLHFDGTNGSTTFFDEKLGANWTAGGTAQISTAQSRYGGASLLLATGDYAQTADAAGWAFGANDFFIEASIRPTSVAPANQRILSQWGPDAGKRAFVIGLAGSTLQFATFPGPVIASSTGISAGVWTDIACGRRGSTIYVWVNGTRSSTTGNIGTNSVQNSTEVIRVGTDYDGSNGFAGYIDEVRVSNLSPPNGNYTVSGPFPTGP